MKILLDNGHGENTPGKRSPDGKLREYLYAREIASMVYDELYNRDYDVELLVPETTDISLSERCKRANKFAKELGNKNVLLVSIHCNAAGNGSAWMGAKGWSIFVSNNASTNSKLLADCLYDAAEQQKLRLRTERPGQKYWQQSLAICRDTNCPAVLTENLFQDNKEDVEFLLSKEGKEAIAKLHVDGIIKYISKIS